MTYLFQMNDRAGSFTKSFCQEGCVKKNLKVRKEEGSLSISKENATKIFRLTYLFLDE